jgi:hypothetical protein
MLLTHASHPDPFEANGMPLTYDSMHQCQAPLAFNNFALRFILSNNRFAPEARLQAALSCVPLFCRSGCVYQNITVYKDIPEYG